jgi:hypothetical protein
MKTNKHFLYLAHFFVGRETFQTEVVEETKKHVLRSVTFIPKSYQYCRKRQATDNMAHAHCMLDT